MAKEYHVFESILGDKMFTWGSIRSCHIVEAKLKEAWNEIWYIAIFYACFNNIA